MELASSAYFSVPSAPSLSPASPSRTKKKRELPPLFWYMEMGDWEKAADRVRRHPREVKTWATLRTKSSAAAAESAGDSANLTNSSSSSNNSKSKRLALHHACFKLRSAGSTPPPSPPFAHSTTRPLDPFVEACRFILLLVRLYPEAAGQRETRHGCLPLHLAAFASCVPRTGTKDEESSASSTTASSTAASSMSSSNALRRLTPGSSAVNSNGNREHNSASGSSGVAKPSIISRRVASDATIDTVQTNMSAVHAEETYAGGMGDKKTRRSVQRPIDPNVSVAMKSTSATLTINPKREEMAVQVMNALLDAYPKAVRVDSEGGRLPLHTACAGRGTPRIISTLVTAYPSAARHRNKDGFLPLHLAAHWGVSHPSVGITLLRAYPDATVGRNRWERTPLEEALCMAGENGRPHQQSLVRALRKHPNYWAHPPPELAMYQQQQQRRKRSVAPVDIDESLPSNESSSEDQTRRYLQYGQDPMFGYDEEMEGTEVEYDQPYSHHLLSRFGHRRGTAKTTSRDEADNIALGPLIQNRNWSAVLDRLVTHPLEAENQLEVATLGGFTASSGMTPLHYACERKPPVEVVNALIEAYPLAVLTRCMPGGALPLHLGCTWHCSADVIGALLTADQTSSQMTDELGNLSLHSACFSGADDQVIVTLLSAHAKAVLTRNNQGSRPVDICKRLRHENRREVMALLTLKKEELMASHRRSHSSGNWSDVAQEAAELNKGAGAEHGFREGDDLQEQAIGVEVTYHDEGDNSGNQELLWI